MVCLRVDVFCKVIDHLGDIGVCLRLVRSLARDKAWSMRIFCDQHRLASLLTDPQIDQVPWYPWPSEEAQLGSFPNVIISAFGCDLPRGIREQLRDRNGDSNIPKALWIHLDYLSAETWVSDFHGLKSYKADGVVQQFCFPGFAADSGGLPGDPPAAMHSPISRPTTAPIPTPTPTSIPTPTSTSTSTPTPTPLLAPKPTHLPWAKADDGRLRVFAYVYEDAPLEAWLRALAIPLRIHLTEALAQQWFARKDQGFGTNAACGLHGVGTLCSRAGNTQESNISIQVMAPCSQWKWDQTMFACDLLFVRGEDSWVQAMRSGIPWLWQPYRQEPETLRAKLNALLERMSLVLNTYLAWPYWREALKAWGLGEAPPQPSLMRLHELNQEWQAMARRWAAHCNSLPRLDQRLCHMIEKHIEHSSAYN